MGQFKGAETKRKRTTAKRDRKLEHTPNPEASLTKRDEILKKRRSRRGEEILLGEDTFLTGEGGV